MQLQLHGLLQCMQLQLHGQLACACNRLPAPALLPLQLATLPQLQRLCLYCYENIDTRSGSASCTRLASLSMLTHLCLVETCIPAADCLGRLPHLRQLAIETGQVDSAADREQLESALARCQQLTLLALNVQFTQELADPEDWDPLLRIPRSVARLHNLRALLFSIECYGSARIDTSLPAGPWLQSLRWLALPWSMAMQQAGTLAAGALALRRLFLSAPPMATAADDFEKAYAHHLPAFESLVADHPALEFVGYVGKHRYSQSWLPDQLVNLLTRLAAQRPGLTVAESPSARFPSDLSYFPAFLEEPHLFGIPFRG